METQEPQLRERLPSPAKLLEMNPNMSENSAIREEEREWSAEREGMGMKQLQEAKISQN